MGEIGIVGMLGAIANAVWHAIGSRIRRFPPGRAEIAAHVLEDAREMI